MSEIEYDYEGWSIPEGHHLATKVTVGTIIFDDVLTEEEIISSKGRFNPSGNIGECKIEVYSGEGDIPHFHIHNADKSFNTCVRIYSPHYFPHGNNYKGKFNSKQLKQLDEWLSSPNSTTKGSNNLEAIKNLWDTSNPSCNFSDDEKVDKKPNYRNMTDYKSK